jgi:hypothetical protein
MRRQFRRVDSAAVMHVANSINSCLSQPRRGADFVWATDHYAHMASMWLVGEDMPRETNRVTLNREVKDKYCSRPTRTSTLNIRCCG